jgi:hypothetical protein
MATQKVFKQRVRTRMAKTGESYTTARLQLLRKASTPGVTGPRALALDPTPTVPPAEGETAGAETSATRADTAAPPPTSDDAVVRASGRSYEEWFRLLDAWGATDRNHAQIARWLVAEHEVNGWWSQSITVAYERARGMRARHQMPSGFEVAVTRTVNVDAERLLTSFTSPSIRRRWLPGADMPQRPTTAAGTARFDWPDPPSRVVVVVIAKGPGKSLASVTHEKLPDAESAERQKAAWRERLAALKAFLERG